MNPNARNFTLKPCYICSFPFSDEHHLYPQRRGGIPVIHLCPNHHRLANILQSMIQDGAMEGDSLLIVNERTDEFFGFDPDFVKRIPDLVTEYQIEEARVADRESSSEYAIYMYRNEGIPLGSYAIGSTAKFRVRHS